MEQFLTQLLNGVAIGQIYALIALGFTLVFGVANMVNFAQGSFFLFGAYASLALVTAGLPLWLSAFVSVGTTALLSVAVERWMLRPLTQAAPMAMLLATLALAMIADEATELVWSADIRAFTSPVAGRAWHFGQMYISGGDLLVLGVGAASAATLIWLLRATWTGRALRAAALDRDAAWQMGVDVFRLREVAFALAGALGAIAGVLVAIYYESVAPQMGMSFALKGFAAAIIGGAASVAGALIGGLGLGVVEALASGYVGEGYRNLVAYGALWAVLMWRPQGLFGGQGARLSEGDSGISRVDAALRRVHDLPAAAWPVVGLMLAALLLARPDGYVLHALELGVIFALLAVSVTLVSGVLGYLSLGHGALFGVGAYVTALLAKSTQFPAVAVLLVATAAAAAVAWGVALSLQRVAGHTIALATLAIGQIGSLVFVNWISVTRGPMGISGIPSPVDGNSDASQWGLYLIVVGPSVFAIWIAQRLVASPVGDAWRALREDRTAAASAGIPVTRYLLSAFAVSGALAGLAGGLFAYVQSVVSPESFSLQTSMLLVTAAVLGGMGNVTGAALAGGFLVLLPELSRGLHEYRMLFYGGLLLLALRLRPQGLLGTR